MKHFHATSLKLACQGAVLDEGGKLAEIEEPPLLLLHQHALRVQTGGTLGSPCWPTHMQTSVFSLSPPITFIFITITVGGRFPASNTF